MEPKQEPKNFPSKEGEDVLESYLKFIQSVAVYQPPRVEFTWGTLVVGALCGLVFWVVVIYAIARFL